MYWCDKFMFYFFNIKMLCVYNVQLDDWSIWSTLMELVILMLVCWDAEWEEHHIICFSPLESHWFSSIWSIVWTIDRQMNPSHFDPTFSQLCSTWWWSTLFSVQYSIDRKLRKITKRPTITISTALLFSSLDNIIMFWD